MNKRKELLALARRRQAARWDGYTNIGDYHDGVYECDYVSPCTKTAGNVDADVMVMLQDWSSDESMRKGTGGPEYWPSDRNLIRLLDIMFGLTLPDVYATNLFPFIKPGAVNADIPQRDLVRAAREFALPQIRIVKPKLVICLGIKTFDALRRACDLRPWDLKLPAAIESPFEIGGTRVWCQAHTGTLGRINRNKGGVDRVADDWRRMKMDYQQRLRKEKRSGTSARS